MKNMLIKGMVTFDIDKYVSEDFLHTHKLTNDDFQKRRYYKIEKAIQNEIETHFQDLDFELIIFRSKK